jgi:hypothetical protein
LFQFWELALAFCGAFSFINNLLCKTNKKFVDILLGGFMQIADIWSCNIKTIQMENTRKVEGRTSAKAKEEFLHTLKSHNKTQSYLINLLVDAFNAQPIECVCALERMKGTKTWNK